MSTTADHELTGDDPMVTNLTFIDSTAPTTDPTVPDQGTKDGTDGTTDNGGHNHDVHTDCSGSCPQHP